MFYFGNTKKLSPSVALLIAIISLIFDLAGSWVFEKEIHFMHALITSSIVFIVSWVALRLILDRFIYERIRVIYKTISTTKRGTNKKIPAYSGKDIIESVNKDVEEWAAERNSEIENLKKMEAYRREFLGNVSHELKTPITTIQGYVLTLLDGGLKDNKINKKYLKRTAKNINRLIAIINDLEEISKIETGMLEMNITNVNLSVLAKDVFDFMEIKAQKHKISLSYEPGFDNAIKVYCDQGKIRQALINLIDNSLKYGKEGGQTSVNVFDMDENVLIEVTDDGVGIEQEDLPRVFERFYRTDKSRSRDMGGTGLGLAIVKHTIEAHNQTINVRSKTNVGTTFGFTLQKATG
ncbi:MAG: two-component sensor histidine kinase [Marinilabiliales bacterium]|nr:MAG: two-component sensor histidine kinase [Marinilabiliales bacterium]